MAKKETPVKETWSSRMKDFGGGDFTFLGTDGEAIIFIVVGLPELLKGTFKKKESERIGCPVVTDEGYQLFICGKRVARKISKRAKDFKDHALMVIRHGAEGDINATYDVRVLEEEETFTRLNAIAKADFEPSLIADSIKQALAVMTT